MRRLFKGESRFWSGCSASAGSENAITPISGKLSVPDVGVLFWGAVVVDRAELQVPHLAEFPASRKFGCAQDDKV